MEALYRHVDWEQIAANKDFIEIQNIKVPYMVFENEEDVTTKGGKELSKRLEKTLGKLWNLYLNC